MTDGPDADTTHRIDEAVSDADPVHWVRTRAVPNEPLRFVRERGVIVVRVRALVWVVSVASCGPTSEGYCDRLNEVHVWFRDYCPELAADSIDFDSCPATLEPSCSRTDLRLLHDKLDCIEAVTDCEDLESLSECQNALPVLSLTCEDARAELTP